MPAAVRRWVFALPFIAYAVSLVALTLAARRDTLEDPALGASTTLLHVLAVGFAGRAGFTRRLAPAVRRAWRFIAVGYVLMVSVMVLGMAATAGEKMGHLLAVGATGRLVMAIMLLIGILSLPMRRMSRRRWVQLAIDLSMVMAGGAMLMWYFLLSPLLNATVPTTTLVSLIFPLCDLVLIAGVSVVLLRGTTSARRPMLALLAGLACYLASDAWLVHDLVTSTTGTVTAHWRAQAMLQTGMFLLGLAAAEQVRAGADAGPAEARRAARPVTVLPYLGLVLGYGLLVLAVLQHGSNPWGGLVAGAVLITGGVAARQALAMRENHRLVVTDSLTGLSNRRRLRDDLDRAVAAARRTGQPVAVLLIDLDGFKQINDSLGHETGDGVLAHFAAVLGREVRAADTAARLGGDEFAVVLQRTDPAEAVGVAERVLQAIAAPITIAGNEITVRASIGIAVSDEATPEARELVHRADVAMYQSKRRQTNSWQLYAGELPVADPADTEAVDDLQRGLDNHELRVLYQPIVDLVDGELVAVEVLVRWAHPTRGMLLPGAFLPAAATGGLLDDVSRLVLVEACAQAAAWQTPQPSGRSLKLCVNVAPEQIAGTTFAADVLATADSAGFDPARLVVEITEAALADEPAVRTQLQALRARGVRIALDDFGSGQSSLGALARLPIDILKLDRCFVANLSAGPGGTVIAEAVVRLATLLNMETVAEGIEEPRQAAHLTALGYGSGQGYHFAEPLTAEAVRHLIATGTADAEEPLVNS